MISAGEASGDAHAAKVVQSLVAIQSDITCHGMGGAQMRSVGVELTVDFTSLAVMGYVDVIINYRKLRQRLDALKNSMRARRPDLLILVDYASFNLKLAETAKELDIPVLFYIGPKLWASRPKRIDKIKQLVTHMALILPFEPAIYHKAGIAADYVGNPSIEQIAVPADKLQARVKIYPSGSDTESDSSATDDAINKTHIGLLPGSRQAELKYNLPVLLNTAAILNSQRNETCCFVLALANGLDTEYVAQTLNSYPALAVNVIEEQSHTVMKACDALMIASGTATLEAAVVGTPSVSLYVMHWLNHAIMRRLITTEHITLVNIQANASVIKEMIQSEATPTALAHEVNRLLDDKDYRDQMIAEFTKIREALNQPALSIDKPVQHSGTVIESTSSGTPVTTSDHPTTTSERVARLAMEMAMADHDN